VERYYTIQIIGCGKNRRWCLKEVETEGPFGPVLVRPVDARPFRSEEDARTYARSHGFEVRKCGDAYQIL
jgi:hypothetical protein